MANRGSGEAESAVPFAPKLNVRSEAGDPLDKAGQTILGWLQRAANTAEANKQQALEVAHKLSAQLRAAEDRVRQLEANARHHEERADRAERWLHQVSVEIQQKFFGREEDSRPSQPPSPQALLRGQRQ
jgi:predicted lysophospholipase L1 biosynthesis ABC-type transport system permease subunit